VWSRVETDQAVLSDLLFTVLDSLIQWQLSRCLPDWRAAVGAQVLSSFRSVVLRCRPLFLLDVTQVKCLCLSISLHEATDESFSEDVSGDHLTNRQLR
jgi:hypothetical protein